MEKPVIFKRMSRGAARRAALAALVLSAPLASAPANAGEEDAVISRGCRELSAFITVPVENVDKYVPDDYVFTTFPGDAAGPATGGVLPVTDMILRAFTCDEQIVDGVTRQNTTSVIFGPQVAFPPDEAKIGFFTLFWVTDNPDLVKWFRRGTAMPQIHHVPDLRFTVDALAPGVSNVVVDAPDTAPWPFRMSAVITEPVAPPQELAIHWWGPVPGHRTLLFTNRLPDLAAGGAIGTVAAAPGTAMAEMFGGHEAHAYFISAKFSKQGTTKSLTDPPTL